MHESNDLIDAIYDAAFDETLWPKALDGFAKCFSAAGATMLTLSGEKQLLYISENLHDAAEEYQCGWFSEDPLVQWGKINNKREAFYSDTELFSHEFIRNSDFYSHFLAKHQIGGISGIVTTPFEGATFSFNLQRNISSEIDGDFREKFAMIARHFKRACLISSTLGKHREKDNSTHALLSIIDRFNCGAAIIDDKQHIIVHNKIFNTVGKKQISINDNRFGFTNPTIKKKFETLVRALNFSVDAPSVLAIPMPDGLLPLVVRIVPLRNTTIERNLQGLHRVPSLLVLAIDLNTEVPNSEIFVLKSLGLTAAQSRVAFLIGYGLSPQEISERLAISTNTVRTTLKAIYSKLGISRQVDLARIISTLKPIL